MSLDYLGNACHSTNRQWWTLTLSDLSRILREQDLVLKVEDFQLHVCSYRKVLLPSIETWILNISVSKLSLQKFVELRILVGEH